MTPARNAPVTKSRFSGWGALMRWSIAAVLCSLCTLAFAADPAHASIKKDTRIPSEGLGAALQSLAKDFDFQVLYRTEVVKDLKTHGAIGSLTSDEALSKVLSGTGLTYKYLDPQTVTLVPVALASGATATDQSQNTAQENGGGKSSSQDFLVAQVDQASAGPQVGSSDQNSEKKPEKLEEVVVTGTHINGGVVTGPLTQVSREDIDLGGFTSVSQAIGSSPMNFGGGINVETARGQTGGAGDSFANLGYASSANLRGLGSNATLVLLDGIRLPDKGDGASVDLSLIPISIVERVDILADGASAIYGSDAIAGVVNVVTRHDFEGLESRVHFGEAADAKPSYQFNQLFGKNWEGGNVEIGFQRDQIGTLDT